MLRLLAVVLLTSLLGSGGVAAGLVTDVPSIVQIVFVGCLGLFVVALATGALNTGGTDLGQSRDPASENSSIAIDASCADLRDPHLEGAQQVPLAGSASD